MLVVGYVLSYSLYKYFPVLSVNDKDADLLVLKYRRTEPLLLVYAKSRFTHWQHIYDLSHVM